MALVLVPRDLFPGRVPLRHIYPEARINTPNERDAPAIIRMATYNAHSALARALAAHYAKADEETHSVLRKIFRASGDINVVGDCLHVRLDGLAAARRSRAVAALCDELNATETRYPGT
jgi:hypothetical protein